MPNQSVSLLYQPKTLTYSLELEKVIKYGEILERSKHYPLFLQKVVIIEICAVISIVFWIESNIFCDSNAPNSVKKCVWTK